MTYGRYTGRTYSWIVMNRPHYVTWARTQPDPDKLLVGLMAFADESNDQGIPTDTGLADVNNDTISLGQFKGRSFAWITLHAPAYINFAAQFVPNCSTDFFRLVQYAEYDGTAAFDTKWRRLRRRHIAWMHAREGVEQEVANIAIV